MITASLLQRHQNVSLVRYNAVNIPIRASTTNKPDKLIMQKLKVKFLHSACLYRKLKKNNKLGTSVSQKQYTQKL